MLKRLKIRDFVLIEEAETEFSSGFTVLSGETGAGKSAIIRALRLVFGETADSSWVRKGCNRASIEAAFSVDKLPGVVHLLEEVGIDHEKGELLIIRRDLSAAGTSRSFVNQQMVQRNLLKQLGGSLVDFVGQHANLRLMALDYHREALDLYGRLENEQAAFAKQYEALRLLATDLNQLRQSETTRLRAIDRCRQELEELEEANLQEGEDDELFQEYSRLANADELGSEVGDVLRFLSEQPGVVATLNQRAAGLEKISQVDSTLAPLADSMHTAALELEEVAFQLTRYRDQLAVNPARMQQLDARLQKINQMKKRYGSTIAAILVYKHEQQQKLQELEQADERIEQLEAKLQCEQDKLDQLAQTLTKRRTVAAKQLEKEIITQLRPLNMPGAQFTIHLTRRERSPTGDDQVEFFFAPNPGERTVSIRSCASGGELSRVLLALKTALAGLERTPTLIFDEIDANIGGETASLVATKLATISQQRQVLCITHLPQVAKQANHHFRVHKETIAGRTVSMMRALDHEERQEELLRMMGGSALVNT